LRLQRAALIVNRRAGWPIDPTGQPIQSCDGGRRLFPPAAGPHPFFAANRNENEVSLGIDNLHSSWRKRDGAARGHSQLCKRASRSRSPKPTACQSGVIAQSRSGRILLHPACTPPGALSAKCGLWLLDARLLPTSQRLPQRVLIRQGNRLYGRSVLLISGETGCRRREQKSATELRNRRHNQHNNRLDATARTALMRSPSRLLRWFWHIRWSSLR